MFNKKKIDWENKIQTNQTKIFEENLPDSNLLVNTFQPNQPNQT